ncbi:MAG: acyltransferase [Acidobacteriota bacterium]
MGTSIRQLGHSKSLRRVHIEDAGKAAFANFVEELAGRIDDAAQDNNEVVREVLAELYLGHADTEQEDWSATRRAAAACFDPRNVTLESEYYADVDADKFAFRKPLIWLWIMFDRSPLGHNVALGTRLRAMLAQHIFAHCGENVRIFRNVEFTYGYNLWVGDDVILHHSVFLDDRGELVLHDRTSLSDFVNVYSHSHHIEDQDDVFLDRTEIGPHARVTYHATILSGVKVGKDSMVGAHALVTKDVDPFTIAGGIPARVLRKKSGSCAVCEGRKSAYVPRGGVEE